MTLLRSARIKAVLVLLFLIVVYNEWISFYIKVNRWPKFSTQPEIESVKILLVADPQILSIQTEPNFPFSYAAVWDANRFVSRSYEMSLRFTNPDIIVFLGDLINDGSTSDSAEFLELVNKFKKLLPTTGVEHVMIIPGDNDIGGEGFDFVSSNKVTRFISAFNSSSPLTFKFVQLYHINIIPGAKEALQTVNSDQISVDNNTYRFVFSHLPLTAGAAKSVQEELNKIKPAAIFSAHDHESYRFVGKKGNPKANQFILFREEGEILELDLKNDDLHEISVPTCSYRMGKSKYGFGFAELNKFGVLRYTVLWLPSRFQQLWCYFWGLVICISLLIYPVLLHFTGRYSATSYCSVSSTKYHRV